MSFGHGAGKEPVGKRYTKLRLTSLDALAQLRKQLRATCYFDVSLDLSFWTLELSMEDAAAAPVELEEQSLIVDEYVRWPQDVYKAFFGKAIGEDQLEIIEFRGQIKRGIKLPPVSCGGPTPACGTIHITRKRSAELVARQAAADDAAGAGHAGAGDAAGAADGDAGPLV